MNKALLVLIVFVLVLGAGYAKEVNWDVKDAQKISGEYIFTKQASLSYLDSLNINTGNINIYKITNSNYSEKFFSVEFTLQIQSYWNKTPESITFSLTSFVNDLLGFNNNVSSKDGYLLMKITRDWDAKTTIKINEIRLKEAVLIGMPVPTTILGNSPPSAKNVKVIPEKPATSDTLTCNYEYSDPDKDPEGDTVIRWYKRSKPQNDIQGKTVDSSKLVVGDNWFCEVTPVAQRGSTVGNPIRSNEVTIVAETAPSPTPTPTPSPTPSTYPDNLTELQKEIDLGAVEFYKQFLSSGECKQMIPLAKKYEKELAAGNKIFDNNYIRAIITVESTWNPEAKNISSYGLMQVTETNLKTGPYPSKPWGNVFDKWNDPTTNIERGTKLLDEYFLPEIVKKNCSDKDVVMPNFDYDWDDVLFTVAYTAGPGNIGCNNIPVSIGTAKPREYVEKVMAWDRIFTENYDKGPTVSDYCKPTEIITPSTQPPVQPPVTAPSECSNCSSVEQCLACVDWKFVAGVFKAS